MTNPKRTFIKQIIESAQGGIVGVQVKRKRPKKLPNGTKSFSYGMTCRVGVVSHLTGGKSNRNDLVTVFRMGPKAKGGYKALCVDNITQISFNGKTYSFDGDKPLITG